MNGVGVVFFSSFPLIISDNLEFVNLLSMTCSKILLMILARCGLYLMNGVGVVFFSSFPLIISDNLEFVNPLSVTCSKILLM